MVLRWIKRHLPTAKQLKQHKSLRWMAKWMEKRPYLWEMHKHSVAGGVSVSLLVAFVPLPLEMVLAAFLAIVFRVNLPVAVLSTWLTNPITFIPANYLIYKTGQFFYNGQDAFLSGKFQFQWRNLGETWPQLLSWLGNAGKMYLIGFPIVSLSAAILGYTAVYLVWTLYEKISSLRRKKK